MQTLHRTTATIVTLMLIALVLSPSAQAVAPAMSAPIGLSLVELKITGDEFILLQNNTGSDIDDLSAYWLNGFNNVNPLASGVSSHSQQMPEASLGAGQTLLLSASPMQTCGASVAGKLSISLADGGGFLQVTQVGMDGNGALSQAAGDFVSWSSANSGQITNVPSSTKSPRAVFYRYDNGISYPWQLADVDPANSCQLNIVVVGGPGSSSAVTPLTLATTSPPATILGEVAGEIRASVGMPVANIGLLAPQISELLPNPIGSGNDNTDEFIEIYNPNARDFDLSGSVLQTGISRADNYVFPSGTILPANGFKAFFSVETKLGLSNTTSHAALLDPAGNVLSSSYAYKTAKDGIAWALAKGKWQWTSQSTPGAANIIKSPATKPKSTSQKSSIKKAGVKGASISNTSSSGSATSGTHDAEEATGVVHTWVLALVGGLALLYGAYEYRRDLANRLLQFRAKFGIGRANRQSIDGGRSD